MLLATGFGFSTFFSLFNFYMSSSCSASLRLRSVISVLFRISLFSIELIKSDCRAIFFFISILCSRPSLVPPDVTAVFSYELLRNTTRSLFKSSLSEFSSLGFNLFLFRPIWKTLGSITLSIVFWGIFGVRSRRTVVTLAGAVFDECAGLTWVGDCWKTFLAASCILAGGSLSQVTAEVRLMRSVGWFSSWV